MNNEKMSMGRRVPDCVLATLSQLTLRKTSYNPLSLVIHLRDLKPFDNDIYRRNFHLRIRVISDLRGVVSTDIIEGYHILGISSEDLYDGKPKVLRVDDERCIIYGLPNLKIRPFPKECFKLQFADEKDNISDTIYVKTKR